MTKRRFWRIASQQTTRAACGASLVILLGGCAPRQEARLAEEPPVLPNANENVQSEPQAVEQLDDGLAKWNEAFSSAASSYAEQDRPAFARHIALAQTLAAEYQAATGEHFQLFLSVGLLADEELALGEPNIALGYFQSALELLNENVPERDFWRANVQAQLAGCYIALDRPREAVQAASEALLVLRQHRQSDALVIALVNHGLACMQLNDFPASIGAFEDLVAVHLGREPVEHDAVANTLCQIAELSLQINDPQRARAALQQAHQTLDAEQLQATTRQRLYELAGRFDNETQTARELPSQTNSQAELAALQELEIAEQEYAAALSTWQAMEEAYRRQKQRTSRSNGRMAASTGVILLAEPPDQSFYLAVVTAEQRLQQAQQRVQNFGR